jgi:hypothetical protein
MFVKPNTDRWGQVYRVPHDPAEGRKDYVRAAGEEVPESQWYLRHVREGVLVPCEPPAAEPEPEPVVEAIDEPASETTETEPEPAPKAKAAKKKGTK